VAPETLDIDAETALVPQLPDSIYSPEQLKALTLELERLISWRSRQDIKEKGGHAVATVPDFELSLEIIDLLGPTEMIARLSADRLEHWQDNLQDLSRQPVTHITLASPVPENLRVALVKWFRSHISPTALLKFEVNRNVVGGMVIRTSNRIIDCSFRSKLLENRNNIPEILRRV
jgi:hypothetical protein